MAAATSTEAILASLAQPVWVVDHEGLIEYVNPAGVAALGYDDLSQMRGRPGHETIHYKRPDGSPFPAAECPMSRSRATGEALTAEEDWFVRRDGSMFPVVYTSTPIDTPAGPGLVVAFTDVERQREAEQAARDRDIARARAEELAAARRRIIEATDAARARLERDLHDGAQQQFVSAVLDLELAERVAGKDPAEATKLRAEAVELAKAGIAELRRLAQGIHPAILTDRGLAPALQSLAARLPVPVTVEEVAAERYPDSLEASVFFFVSESLANVVKHANATRASIRVAAQDATLVVEVSDDGRGGAAPARGSGLRGLDDRISALDGTLVVDSPAGEGTRLRAEIPLPG